MSVLSMASVSKYVSSYSMVMAENDYSISAVLSMAGWLAVKYY
jgi:hypothetical protein